MSEFDRESASATERASAIKRAYQAELMSKANVVGVGVGYRTVDGQPTEDIVLVVMVNQKVPKTQLAPQDLVPREIEGVPVDVQEVGVLRAQ